MNPARAWVVVAVVCLFGCFGQTANAAVPPGFFGVVPQAAPTANDLTRMEGVVGTLRIPIYWAECEPAPGEYDFSALDALVGAAAEHGIRVQPFVLGTPSWLASKQARPPLDPRASAGWTEFLSVLVKRYGTGGEFWQGRAQRQPIKLWQIWNEPNFVIFWRPWPQPRAYARLLHISARAIRSADPRAQIALAGVAPVNSGVKTWVFLRRLFRVAGVRRDFDVAAIHPYSTTLPELDYQLRKVRGAMVGAGLGSRPLLVSEMGVASEGDYPSVFVRGLSGQADFLRTAYARLLELRRRWRIAGIDWFALQDAARPDPNCVFCQGAGLFDLADRPKPAWWALLQTVKSSDVR
jgi:hypothetical protein